MTPGLWPTSIASSTSSGNARIRSSSVSAEVTLYAASADTLLERIGAFPDEVDDAMLVGHNPGVMDLVLLLARPGSLRDRASENVPTGALAVLDLDARRWPDVSAGSATLRRFVVPRDL